MELPAAYFLSVKRCFVACKWLYTKYRTDGNSAIRPYKYCAVVHSQEMYTYTMKPLYNLHVEQYYVDEENEALGCVPYGEEQEISYTLSRRHFLFRACNLFARVGSLV